jgi:hypothetical protein
MATRAQISLPGMQPHANESRPPNVDLDDYSSGLRSALQRMCSTDDDVWEYLWVTKSNSCFWGCSAREIFSFLLPTYVGSGCEHPHRQRRVEHWRVLAEQ